MDITFQYPPDLLSLLIDALPKLCRSKKDLLIFFQGAGVSQDMLAPFHTLLDINKDGFNKYIVTRELIANLNALGERGLRERREILKRVTEFHDFSVCWDKEQSSARGLVAQIRELVNAKDAFTRMNMERERERRARLAEQEVKAVVERGRKAKLAEIKARFFALFGEQNAHKRGKALEAVLNSLFASHGMLVREAFTIKRHCGEGVIEQIDGLVEVEGQLYLVELKWWGSPLGIAEVSPHIVRIYNRGGHAHGLFISYSEFTEPAISTCRSALAGSAVLILAKLQELVELLNDERDLKEWLKAKKTAAIVDKNPLFFPFS